MPTLNEKQYLIDTNKPAEGFLFVLPAIGLKEQREERRRTIKERCEKTAELVEGKKHSIIWCHLNDEGDILDKIISDSVQVSGKDSDDVKEEKFYAFTSGSVKRIITKPKIGAWGLNWQHCNHEVFFPSHSYEQYYQGVRRCWRFGQKNPVYIDIVTTEGEKEVLDNLKRKDKAASVMFDNLVFYMNQSLNIKRTIDYTEQEELPQWLSSIN